MSFKNIVGKKEIARNEPPGELYAIFIKFEIVVCKLVLFERVKNLSFGKGLKVEIVW